MIHDLPHIGADNSNDKATAAPVERSLYDDVMGGVKDGAGAAWGAIKDGYNYSTDAIMGLILPKYDLADFGLDPIPALPMPGDPPQAEPAPHIPFENPFKNPVEPPPSYSICDNPVLAASEPGLCGF